MVDIVINDQQVTTVVEATDGSVVVETSGSTSVVSTPEESTVVVLDPVVGIVTEASTSIVIADQDVVTVLTDGIQGPTGTIGPTGPQGASGGEIVFVATAGAALGGHRVVFIDSVEKAQYASNQTSSHSLVSLGITLGAANINETVNVQRVGPIIEPSWSWTLFSPVYLGIDGLLTQTPPASPALFQRIVGFPLAATKLYVSFREPVFIL